MKRRRGLLQCPLGDIAVEVDDEYGQLSAVEFLDDRFFRLRGEFGLGAVDLFEDVREGLVLVEARAELEGQYRGVGLGEAIHLLDTVEGF